MKKLVFVMLAVLGMSLTSCFGDKPATKEEKQDSTICVLPASEGEVDDTAPELKTNTEAGKAAVTEEKKDAPIDDKAAPAENTENAEKK